MQNTAIITAHGRSLIDRYNRLTPRLSPVVQRVMMLETLNQRFAIPDALTFVQHSSNLIQGQIDTSACTGSFFLLGGHVAAFEPKSGRHPVLFMSDEAVFEVGKPIRGGVPICFPWFGPNKVDSSLPSHGLARIQPWNVLRTQQSQEAVVVELGLDLPPYDLLLRIDFGQSLTMTLTITNVSKVDQQCEVALHTYFSLGDVAKCRIGGLENAPFLDQLTRLDHLASHNPITFTKETDCIYRGEVGHVKICDQSWNRTITVEQCGSKSTVVWNPWIEKSKRLTDFGDQEYLKMCCVETANIAPDVIRLASGQSFTIASKISAD